MSEPVRTPVRRFTNHYAIFFEDLIHAVKSEIVGRVDHVDRRVENADKSLTAAYEAISDQLAVQTATLRSLSREVEDLRALVATDPAFGTLGAGASLPGNRTSGQVVGDPVLNLAEDRNRPPDAPKKPAARNAGPGAAGTADGSVRSADE